MCPRRRYGPSVEASCFCEHVVEGLLDDDETASECAEPPLLRHDRFSLLPVRPLFGRLDPDVGRLPVPLPRHVADAVWVRGRMVTVRAMFAVEPAADVTVVVELDDGCVAKVAVLEEESGRDLEPPVAAAAAGAAAAAVDAAGPERCVELREEVAACPCDVWAAAAAAETAAEWGATDKELRPAGAVQTEGRAEAAGVIAGVSIGVTTACEAWRLTMARSSSPLMMLSLLFFFAMLATEARGVSDMDMDREAGPDGEGDSVFVTAFMFLTARGSFFSMREMSSVTGRRRTVAGVPGSLGCGGNSKRFSSALPPDVALGVMAGVDDALSSLAGSSFTISDLKLRHEGNSTMVEGRVASPGDREA